MSVALTHLERLESESIHIMREVVADSDKPVMLYSVGKDSAVMLHLARMAFYPSPPPFPLLHVDTTWKFRAMYEMRDRMARESGMQLIVYRNPEAMARGINPFDHGSLHTDLWKTEGLKQALAQYGFDSAFGGARRDEEKSRAKERIYSFRDGNGQWDPKNQRPELWNLYNARIHPGESIRVFPLSNWTEMDVWQYIHEEKIPVVDLYFAKERPMYVRSMSAGQEALLPIEQDFVAWPGEKPQMVKCRLRSLGCSPCTGAIRSDAETIPDIIAELISFRSSERANRVIDHDQEGSMEIKKREGYF
jgi:sulfate adenylyltransferase subunit 2